MTHAEIVLHPLIIPSVVIPFTALLAGLSVLATFIAGIFGLKLKAEGPKKLLEVLLKPRVLLVALISNLVIIGVFRGYYYWKNAPVMMWRIEKKQRELARPSPRNYGSEDKNLKMHFAVDSFESNISKGTSKSGLVKLMTGRTVNGSAKELASGRIEVVWSKKLESGSFRGAVVSGSSAFVGIDKGLVHEFNTADGEIQRSFFVGTAVSAAPLIHKGALFVGEGVHDTHHARLYKFDLSTGAFLNSFSSQGHIEGEPVAGSFKNRDAILLPSGAGGLCAVDSQTLKQLWQVKDGHVDSSVRVEDGMVFVGTGLEKENLRGKKGSAYAYDLETGRKIWQRELPASSWMRPIAWRDRICFVFGEVYFPSDLGGVYCFRRSDGAPDVSYNNAAPIVAEAILIDDDLVVADLKGKMCRVSLIDGRAKWCRETGDAKVAFANPVFDSKLGVLLYPSQIEGFLVIEPNTGQTLAKWKTEDESTPWSKTYAPVALANDGWITVDMKGVIRLLRWRSENQTAALVR